MSRATTRGREIDLVVGAPCAGGAFVARAEDGRVTFVRHAISGERVRARVTEETTSFLRADAIEILEASPLRVRPSCAHAGPRRCGGCDFQHISLEGQREFKSKLVHEQLRRLAGLDLEPVVEAVAGDRDGLAWRTRVRYGVDRDLRLGFRRHRSHEIEAVEQCPLASPAIAALGLERARFPGVRELRAASSDDGTVRVVRVPARSRQLRASKRGTERLAVDALNDSDEEIVTHTVLSRNYRVGAGVFWQVHPGAASTLAQGVLDSIGDVRGRRVLDLYCGAGLFTALVAQRVGRHGGVVGVERAVAACADARRNTADLPQVSIENGDVSGSMIDALDPRPVLAILDPPREGAGRRVMKSLCDLAPELERIVYLSCDPATFARDLKVALESEWRLESLRAFDCFPMTEHVELLGVLIGPKGCSLA